MKRENSPHGRALNPPGPLLCVDREAASGEEFMGDGEGMGQLSRAKAGGRGPETREQGKVSGGIGGQTGMRRRLSRQQGARRGQLAAQPGGQAWPTGTLGDSCSDLCPGTKAVVWSAWRLLASLPLPCPLPALLFTAVHSRGTPNRCPACSAPS